MSCLCLLGIHLLVVDNVITSRQNLQNKQKLKNVLLSVIQRSALNNIPLAIINNLRTKQIACLIHWGSVTQICVFCVFALQFWKTNEANLRLCITILKDGWRKFGFFRLCITILKDGWRKFAFFRLCITILKDRWCKFAFFWRLCVTILKDGWRKFAF
jgi:hypothetical protein